MTITLEDLRPMVEEFMIPHIEDGLRTALAVCELDRYNDGYVFGTTLWRNISLRLRAAARAEDCPFTANSDGSFLYRSVTIRHHRVGRTTQLPRGGKRAKAEADQLAFEFVTSVTANPENLNGSTDEPTMLELASSVVIGIDADDLNGLHEIFLGRLSKVPGTNKYEWEERITLATAGSSTVTLHAEETIPIPELTLVDPNQSPNDVTLDDTPAKSTRAS